MKQIYLKLDAKMMKILVHLKMLMVNCMKHMKFNSILQVNICIKDSKLIWKSKSFIKLLMEKLEIKPFYLSYIIELQELLNLYLMFLMFLIYQILYIMLLTELWKMIYMYWTSYSMINKQYKTLIHSHITSIKVQEHNHHVKNTLHGL